MPLDVPSLLGLARDIRLGCVPVSNPYQQKFELEQQYLTERMLAELRREVRKSLYLDLPPTVEGVHRREWEFEIRVALKELAVRCKRLVAESSQAAASMPPMPALDGDFTDYAAATLVRAKAYNRRYDEVEDTIRRLSQLAAKFDLSLPYPAPEPLPASSVVVGPHAGAGQEEQRAVNLSGWAEILDCVGRRNGRRDRALVKKLNAKFSGPIVITGPGSPPMVRKDELLGWWNGLVQQWREELEKQADQQATVQNQYPYSKDGTAVPDLSGHVKKTRRKGADR
jgi:hypothetical protein